MTAIQTSKNSADIFAPPRPPDHLQLPETDGAIVQNFLEHPQSILLTDAIQPVLRQLHPDSQYCIGHDCGIYWRWHEQEPLEGCKAPDWFYVPGVPPMLGGTYRRSYVLWNEVKAPLVAIEFVSGDGSEERDRTPETGKFWVYEQGIRIPYYAIYDVNRGKVEVHHLDDLRYRPMEPNERGHFDIPPLGELGIWTGRFQNLEVPWLRWWDLQGNLLPTSDERAVTEAQRAEQERQRAQRLAEKLRALGIDPDQV